MDIWKTHGYERFRRCVVKMYDSFTTLYDVIYLSPPHSLSKSIVTEKIKRAIELKLQLMRLGSNRNMLVVQKRITTFVSLGHSQL